MRRRMFKGPCKILLSSSEFVFPKVPPDSRRVSKENSNYSCDYSVLEKSDFRGAWYPAMPADSLSFLRLIRN